MPTSSAEVPFVDRRSWVYFVASAAAVLSSMLLVLVRGADARSCWFELSSCVVCLLAGVGARSPVRRSRQFSSALLGTFFLVTPPLQLLFRGDPLDLVVMCATPLALALVFVDRVAVVVAVSVIGLFANTATLLGLQWKSVEVVRAFIVMFALYGAGVVSSAAFARLRRRQREHQQGLLAAASAQSQSERLAHIGLLAAGVAHEINNPLSYIAANLSFLETEDAHRDDPERADAWRDTQQGLAHIASIVADLKGLARDESKGVATIDVRQVLERVARLAQLRASSQVRVTIDVPESPVLAMSDELRLTQALTNLIVNACDALEGMTHHVGEIFLRAEIVSGAVQLDVEDNGPGIPADVRPHLFTPFFTTKPVGKGTGLGLSLSRQYVESFGGELTLQPSVTGAHFRIVLRAA